VFQGLNCIDARSFSLPFPPACKKDLNEKLLMQIKLFWTNPQNEVVWAVRCQGKDIASSYGLIDFAANTNVTIQENINENAELLGVSPSGEWLLFYDSYNSLSPDLSGLFATSIKNGSVQHLMDDTPTGYFHFYGWITAP
jgi:hypothetical protein